MPPVATLGHVALARGVAFYMGLVAANGGWRSPVGASRIAAMLWNARIVLLLVALALVSCTRPGERLGLQSASEIPSIVATGGLRQYVGFREPVVQPETDSRPMRVLVQAKSLVSGHSFDARYRFEFFDADGESRSKSPWGFQRFEPRQTYVLEGAATEAGAAGWRLYLQPLR